MDHSGVQVTCMVALPVQLSALYYSAAVLSCGFLEVCIMIQKLDENVAD